MGDGKGYSCAAASHISYSGSDAKNALQVLENSMNRKNVDAYHEHRFVLPPPGGNQTTGQCSCGMKREFSNRIELEGFSINRRPRIPTGGFPYDPLLQSVKLDFPTDCAGED